MSLAEINWNPTDRQLRQFGAISFVAVPVITWFWDANWTAIGIAAAVGAAICLVGWFFPRGLQPLFVGLMVVTYPIGLVVGELLMMMIYYGVFLPIGCVFRLMGRDPLERHIDRQAATYWQTKKHSTDPASYFRQF
jgi:hypothetical protein